MFRNLDFMDWAGGAALLAFLLLGLWAMASISTAEARRFGPLDCEAETIEAFPDYYDKQQAELQFCILKELQKMNKRAGK